MARRTPPSPPFGALAHFEVMSNEPAATKDFYAKVFGWKFNDVPAMEYSLIETPGAPGGGLMKTPADAPGPGVSTFVNVENLDKVLQKITSSGGRVVKPRQEVPGFGAFAVFEAPGGVIQALWEAVPHEHPHPTTKRGATKKKAAARKTVAKTARKTAKGKATKGRARRR